MEFLNEILAWAQWLMIGMSILYAGSAMWLIAGSEPVRSWASRLGTGLAMVLLGLCLPTVLPGLMLAMLNITTASVGGGTAPVEVPGRDMALLIAAVAAFGLGQLPKAFDRRILPDLGDLRIPVREAPLPAARAAVPGPTAPPEPVPAVPSGKRVWDRAVARDNSVRDTWAMYDTDLDMLLRHPVMQDLEDPVTRTAVQALHHLQDARPAKARMPRGFDAQHPYAVAAREAELALDTAVRRARRMGASLLGEKERKHLSQAQKLLSQALDASCPPAERQSFYEAVLRLVQGIVVIPEQADASIRRTIQKQIAR